MDAASARTHDQNVKGSPLEGLWIILVEEDEVPGTKTPMLARAGNGLYLLAFRTGHAARKFIADSHVDGEPRMVVAANAREVMDAVNRRGVAGVLVDYDFGTNTYREAAVV